MRVFVVGTGRCGTVTFARACKHITNYTVSHESHKGQVGNLNYPDNHIEVDPHLVWVMAIMMDKYPNAHWVHLVRDAKTCIPSLAKRKSLANWCRFACQAKPDIKKAAELHYMQINRLIERLLDTSIQQTRIHLWKIQE